MDNNIEQHLKSLEFFENWSNYMLVTTVAALGWVAKQNTIKQHVFEMWCFALSIVFAILTLALIPIVAGQLTKETLSFYDEWPRFHIWLIWGRQVSIPIKLVCLPQHILFLLGILGFTYHKARVPSKLLSI